MNGLILCIDIPAAELPAWLEFEDVSAWLDFSSQAGVRATFPGPYQRRGQSISFIPCTQEEWDSLKAQP